MDCSKGKVLRGIGHALVSIRKMSKILVHARLLSTTAIQFGSLVIGLFTGIEPTLGNHEPDPFSPGHIPSPNKKRVQIPTTVNVPCIYRLKLTSGPPHLDNALLM